MAVRLSSVRLSLVPVVGSVTRCDTGFPVDGALVTLAGIEAGSNGAGEFSFEGVQAGHYELRAEKVIDGELLVAELEVEVEADVDHDPYELCLAPDEDIPPPTLEIFTRKLEFNGTFRTVDDDSDIPTDGGDDTGEGNLFGTCEVSPVNQRSQTITLQSSASQCVDDEVRVQYDVTCVLLADNQTVQVTIRGRMWEGAGCGNEDLDTDESHDAIDTPAGEESTTGVHLGNDDEGGDTSDITLTWTNADGVLIELPNVTPENRRDVILAGEVSITDDDAPDSDEQGTFLVSERCLVDPFDRVDSFGWNACVDDEVRVELRGRCELARDNVGVNVKIEAFLFEGSTCVTDEQEDSASNEEIMAPCGGSCLPSSFALDVDNRGTDKASIRIDVSNNQQ